MNMRPRMSLRDLESLPKSPSSTLPPDPSISPELNRRRDSVWEAYEFIHSFVREGWEDHMSEISIVCDLTIQELHKIGYMPRHEGTTECRKLVRVPVINDTIGSKLWERLAILCRGPDGLDNPDLDRAWHQRAYKERMRQELNVIRQRRGSREAVGSPPQSPIAAGCHFCPRSQHHQNLCTVSGSYQPLSVGSSQHQLEQQRPETDGSLSPRKMGWIFPGRRNSSITSDPGHRQSSPLSSPSVRRHSGISLPASTAVSPASPPVERELWQEGFWQQESDGVRSPFFSIAPFAAIDPTAAATTTRSTSSYPDGGPSTPQRRISGSEKGDDDSASTAPTTSATNPTAKRPGSPRTGIVSRPSLKKIMLRKLSASQLLCNINEFGESLGVGYGTRDQSSSLGSTPTTEYANPFVRTWSN